MKKIITLFAALLFAFSVSSQTPLTTAVDFTVTDVDGTQHNLFNYLNGGKYVLIDFFFTTCGPCQVAAPQCNASYVNFGCNTGGVIFLGIDNGDNDAQVIAFGNTYGAHYPAASGTQGGGDAVCTAYGITAYPTFILIAPNKNIVEQDIWPFSTQICNNKITAQGVQPKSCPSASVEENTDGNINLLIMPNPAADVIKAYFFAAAGKKYQITLNDMLGKTVFSSDINGYGDYVSHSMDVSKLAQGAYSMVISEDNTRIAIQKVLINR
jgi:thiol-disulfide isomerase/thioredoxin